MTSQVCKYFLVTLLHQLDNRKKSNVLFFLSLGLKDLLGLILDCNNNDKLIGGNPITPLTQHESQTH